MKEISNRKEFWLSLGGTTLISFATTVALYDWLVVLGLTFFVLCWGVRFHLSKCSQWAHGFQAGIIAGLVLGLAFIVFGPVPFYE